MVDRWVKEWNACNPSDKSVKPMVVPLHIVESPEGPWRKALILTLAGGGGRPPKSRRQITVPRSKDRRGNSDFPAGLAGGRLQTARQPSGKEASTMKPARNRAGGVEAVRRVQLHPSRISLSAQQTVKYM
ncbi:hypothetical protein NDU88_003980 [Pleurodeles waltl]|uniref:Uncharacterized protein n=1 Tax=Pleurodeles waltl TaxID=8319 RepID=A0AAV7W3Y2_PLEWA|nr:hypothetical protein NDU88_003980 [Pleurodeles waltl]